jgi:methylmalonyl-CoA/ethylmalonyl-CoA epimerase
MIRAITEVGVAVRDLHGATALLVERLGARPGPVQRFEPYGMEFCMCRVGNVDFELMAPLDDTGVIARFLARRGEGVHHIGFAVDDVAARQREMEARGLEFVEPEPRRQRFVLWDGTSAAAEADVAFAFSKPSSLLGMLLEFIEYPAGHPLPKGGTA